MWADRVLIPEPLAPESDALPTAPYSPAFKTPGPPSEHTWQRVSWQCYILNFKYLSLAVLEKKNLSIIYFGIQDTLSKGHFRPQGHHFNKFGRGLLETALDTISKP